MLLLHVVNLWCGAIETTYPPAQPGRAKPLPLFSCGSNMPADLSLFKQTLI